MSANAHPSLQRKVIFLFFLVFPENLSSSSAGGPLLYRASCERGPPRPFCSVLSPQRLMNWLCGCCQCVCTPGEGVPVTGGNLSNGIRPGAAIVAVLQGALGAGGPGSCSTAHTAVTPLETRSPQHAPLWWAQTKWLCREQWVCRKTTWLGQTSFDGNS